MNISKVVEDKKNQFLNRRELKILVESDKNPSFAETSKAVSDKEKSPEENIVIEKIKGKFGRSTFLITAKIYNNKEDKDKLEKKKVKDNKQGNQEAKPEENK